ncbi:MAG: TrmJ/YjtD family RNA methyltransferase [Pelagibacteraceae bacterium TMED247]|nr:hypothetical protein [Candidatus Pelagibacter sp.]RPG05549.1 MAG: TrmJ/YjtD family RNA methyltransferase [Pelagibacteraceae bacterium TMED247]|tara:strand:- start:263 stop:967 length:705 start_codon:yes stop_codon:yes gene_type:complete
MINRIGFLLVKPQLPENIGFCARGLKNFGFKKLDLVKPKELWPNKKASATSVGAKDVLNKTKVYSNIKDAINKYDVVYASSARRRDINKRHLSFNQFIQSIKKNKKKKIGIMFGPEASGLSNEEISYSNYIFKIPVNKNFESINLSHSVILICYEIFKNLKSAAFKKEKKLIDIVSKKKLNVFFDFVENRLDNKGFFSPKEKKKSMLINLRNIFERTQLSNKELRILSSVFSKL